MLLNQTETPREVLFHPIGSGLGAMRYKQYKAILAVAGQTPCIAKPGEVNAVSSADAVRFARNAELAQSEPLPVVFDLDKDPSESTPLKHADIPDVLAALQRALDTFFVSVNSTLRSHTDYSSNASSRACGNTSSPCCRTHRAS